MRAAVLWAGLGAGAIALGAQMRDASACGGCFHEPPGPTMSGTVVTDHRMIFAVSPTQTTLYDQVKYTGAPSEFAWVLPIKGTVSVGVSSDTLFAALDSVTTTTLVAPRLPPCPPPPSCPCCNCGGGTNLALGGAADASAAFAPPVVVTSMSVVGPYEQSQLHSTDPMALETWLAAHNYVIPAAVQPIITAYVREGFDFLAIRLQPGQGVQAMRPISVTTPGAGLSLPLRMVAAGTGATVGITLWVVATGRYEPMNFSQFTISGSELTWDWTPSVNSSNYSSIRTQVEASYGNAAWQIESSLNVSPYSVESVVLGAPNDYLPVPPSDAGADAGSGITASAARQQDLLTCFPNGASGVRVTRMRADLSQAALANDLVLQAAADQSTMSNLYQVTQSVNQPVCPTYPPLSCAPCGNNNGDDSGAFYSGDDGGGGLLGGGGSSAPAANGKEASGCTTAPSESRSPGVELALAGLVGVSLLRSRRKKPPTA